VVLLVTFVGATLNGFVEGAACAGYEEDTLKRTLEGGTPGDKSGGFLDLRCHARSAESEFSIGRIGPMGPTLEALGQG